MKRSRNLKLTLMAVALPAALAGCDSTPTGTVMASVEDCSKTQEVSVEQCEVAYLRAQAEHERVAPRFESEADCAAQFGHCTAINENGHTSMIPPMAGFLVGYAMAGGLNSRSDCQRDPQRSGCSSGGGTRLVSGSSPLYRDYSSGDYLKPNGDYAAILAACQNVDVVISSSWRVGASQDYLLRCFPEALRHRIRGVTPNFGGAGSRYDECLSVAKASGCRLFVALDDDASHFPAECHWLLLTDRYQGLDARITAQVISRFARANVLT